MTFSTKFCAIHFALNKDKTDTIICTTENSSNYFFTNSTNATITSNILQSANISLHDSGEEIHVNSKTFPNTFLQEKISNYNTCTNFLNSKTLSSITNKSSSLFNLHNEQQLFFSASNDNVIKKNDNLCVKNLYSKKNIDAHCILTPASPFSQSSNNAFPNNFLYENEENENVNELVTTSNELQDFESLTNDDTLLLSTAIENLAQLFENAFMYVLSHNFKSKSYGLICTEVVDSFLKHFLSQIVSNALRLRMSLFLEKKTDETFLSSEKNEENKNQQKNLQLNEYAEKNITFSTRKSNNNLYENNAIKPFCEEEQGWKIDKSGNNLSVFVKNIIYNKIKNEIRIKYFNETESITDERKKDEENVGMWLTTEELKDVLKYCKKYQDDLKCKLCNFLYYAKDIYDLSIAKYDYETMRNLGVEDKTDEIEKISKKRKIEMEEKKKMNIKYGDFCKKIDESEINKNEENNESKKDNIEYEKKKNNNKENKLINKKKKKNCTFNQYDTSIKNCSFSKHKRYF